MKPSIILFDVNETLSDMSPMGQRFVDVGAPALVASYGSRPCCATALRSPPPETAAASPGSAPKRCAAF